MRHQLVFLIAALAALVLLSAWSLLAASAEAEWDINDPGVHNPNGVFFTDSLHGVVTGVRRTERGYEGVKGSPVRCTDDGGLTWYGGTVPEEVFYAYSPWLVDRERGWCVGRLRDNQGHVLLATEDGGRHWTGQPLPETGWVRSIWFEPAGHGWLLSQKQLWRTQDGGQSWQPQDPPPGMRQYGGSFYATDMLHLVVIGHDSQSRWLIAQTTDGGENWSQNLVAFQGGQGLLQAIHFAPGMKVGWVVGMEGERIENRGHIAYTRPLVLHTADGGKSWQRQELNTRSQLRDVWALSETEAWICSFGAYALPQFAPGRLFHTTEGGATWQNESPAGCSLHKLFFLDAAHGWAAGGAGGSSWEPNRVVYTLLPSQR